MGRTTVRFGPRMRALGCEMLDGASPRRRHARRLLRGVPSPGGQFVYPSIPLMGTRPRNSGAGHFFSRRMCRRGWSTEAFSGRMVNTLVEPGGAELKMGALGEGLHWARLSECNRRLAVFETTRRPLRRLGLFGWSVRPRKQLKWMDGPISVSTWRSSPPKHINVGKEPAAVGHSAA